MGRYVATSLGAALLQGGFLLMCDIFAGVEGHMYQMLPVSRPYYLTNVFNDG